ncbi:MAG TPA: hypothetical protein VMV69_15940 [Pirellulales bacterium]|nr:hypothetical protein [Pirellulales bacterium]
MIQEHDCVVLTQDIPGEGLLGPHLATVPLTPSMHQRAAMVRGTYHYGLADSLHLAVAVESRYDRFLTNDFRLAGFPDVLVEVLP